MDLFQSFKKKRRFRSVRLLRRGDSSTPIKVSKEDQIGAAPSPKRAKSSTTAPLRATGTEPALASALASAISPTALPTLPPFEVVRPDTPMPTKEFTLSLRPLKPKAASRCFTTTAKDQSYSALCTSIPAEIRLLIFAKLLDIDLEREIVPSIRLSRAQVRPSPFVLTCRQIYYETMEPLRKAYWSRNSFIIDKTYGSFTSVRVQPFDLAKITRFVIQVPGRQIAITLENGLWVPTETAATKGSDGEQYLQSVQQALADGNMRRSARIRGDLVNGGLTGSELNSIVRMRCLQPWKAY